MWPWHILLFFFFQAEDGIRDLYVTGVQTCALPISLARDDQVGRVALVRQGAPVGDRRHPGVLGEWGRQRRVGGVRRAKIHRPGPALLAALHVEADVRGDAIKPGAQRRAAFEAADTLPGADHRLLHGVLGLEARAEHPIGVRRELPAVLLEVFGTDFAAEGGITARWHVLRC